MPAYIESRFTVAQAGTGTFAWGDKVNETYRFVPTEVANTDTISWSALVDTINADFLVRGKPAIIEIQDNAKALLLDGSIRPTSVFLAPVFILGSTPNARLKITKDHEISFGGYANMFLDGSVIAGTPLPSFITRGTFTAVTAGSVSITGVTGVTLSVGDSIVLFSNVDAIPDADPHIIGGVNHPAEYYRVVRITGSGPSAVIFLDHPVVNAITASPQICRVDMLPNSGLANLRLEFGVSLLGGGSQHRWLKAFRVKNFIFENVITEKSPGYVELQCFENARISGYLSYGQPIDINDYGVSFGMGSGFVCEDSVFYNARHAVTTGGQNGPVTQNGVTYNLDDEIWGTPYQGRIRNCVSHMFGDGVNSWSAFDTHSAGYDIEFQKCLVTNTINVANAIGFSLRSRESGVVDCEVRSNAIGAQWCKGVELRGGHQWVRNLHMENGWLGVSVRDGYAGGQYDDLEITGGRFVNLFGPAVHVVAGHDRVTVSRIQTEKCGSNTATGDTAHGQSIITFMGGVGHRIEGCHLRKDTTNLDSIDFGPVASANAKPIGNYVLGYGANDSGFTASTAPVAGEYETLYGAKNFRD